VISVIARKRALLRAALLLVPLLATGAGEPSGTLHIEISNVRNHTGRVHVDLCTQTQFLKDCPIAGDAPAKVGTTMVTITGLKPGHYGAQVFYDENGNGKVDRALFGIPKEGVGFSNDARIRWSPPKWDEAVFPYDGQERTIRLKLRYFIGPDAPVASR
jgi:uncharacterized protein (DUF2141 family)